MSVQANFYFLYLETYNVTLFQGVSFLWEQYEQQEQRMYHSHRSYAGISLAIARLLLATIFMSHLRSVITKERSALKRDFYNSFTKVWYLKPKDILEMTY